MTNQKKVASEARIVEIVDNLLRKAFRDQARDLEKHLNNIDKRLSTLEDKTKRA